MRRTACALVLLAAAALVGACKLSQPAEEAPEPSPSASAEPQAGTETPGAEDEEVAEDTLPAPDPDAPTLAGIAEAEPPEATLPETQPREPVPHIYLAVQPGGTGRPSSAVFAIDTARDGTPSDDPAIRLTPDSGRCNPQEMRNYTFPKGATPVVGEAEEERGLTAADLPSYLAATVTGRLIEAGLATEAEDTRPLNVCTRKLWERLVVAGNSSRTTAAQ